jgi:short-subunit dehydrogenase
MSQQSWENKVALVTGASSGIGWETARLLAQKGMRVAITARREDRLETLAATIREQGGTVLVLPADLQNLEERQQLYTTVVERWGPIDILINNAGFGWGEPFAEMEWETMQDMVDVNILALLHLTRLALPQMVARSQGWVINIASIAGDLPTPPLSLYCATKSMVQAISEALYREVGRQGVHVSVVNPGPIATEFGAVAYGWSVDKATHKGTPPSAVAEAIWWAISRRRKRVYVPWYFRAARWVNLVFEFLVDWLHPIVINALRRDQRR